MRLQIRKYATYTLGWLSLALGTLGIFLPLLPTVPLWLLSAWCFARSSTRAHNWLQAHPKIGPVLKAWQHSRGVPRQVKLRAICLLWASLILSMFIVGKLWAVLLLSTIGLCTSIYLCRLPTVEINDSKN